MSQIYIPVSSGNLPPSVPTSFITDVGTAIPAGQILNINGGPGVIVSANPNLSNNVLITLTEVSSAYTNVTFAMSPYTVLITDYFISVDSTLGPVTINLPDSPPLNKQFIIKDRLGKSLLNNITVKSITGASTIDGQPSYIFVDNFESLECLFHTTNYEVF